MVHVKEQPGPKLTRAEYIEVEPNVRLHITDAGEGRPIVLIHGWPLINNDKNLTGKIAWAHLKEFPDYYTRLEKLEKTAGAYWKSKGKR